MALLEVIFDDIFLLLTLLLFFPFSEEGGTPPPPPPSLLPLRFRPLLLPLLPGAHRSADRPRASRILGPARYSGAEESSRCSRGAGPVLVVRGICRLSLVAVGDAVRRNGEPKAATWMATAGG